MISQELAAVIALAVAGVLFACGGEARAAVAVPKLFSDGMVLQAGASAPVWGTAAPGAAVSVDVAGVRKETRADADGRWRVDLEDLAPGGPHTLVIEGGNRIEIRDVYCGEVWVASGQSNMEYGLHHVRNAEVEIATADYPQIRVFTVKTVIAGEPQEDVEGAWQRATPEAARNFTGLGYLFARGIHLRRDVPVGLIHSSVSGTIADAWTPLEALGADPDLRPILERFAAEEAAFAEQQKAFDQAYAAWQKTADAAKAAGKKPLPAPRAPQGPGERKTRPAGLFNGKIAPLIPYGIRGVIWYQGEANGPRGEQYRTLFPALINAWRARWGRGAFPFLYVQLANLHLPPDDIAKFHEVREAQLMTLSVPNTGMAVACDVGDPRNIHPPNKQAVAERLVGLARKIAYGGDLVASGPLYREMTVEGDRVRIAFDAVGAGLVSNSGLNLAGFVLAGADQTFQPAVARIDGETVVVWREGVDKPVAVRYGWANNPDCSLTNAAGLPASPFRTDDWPIASTGVR